MKYPIVSERIKMALDRAGISQQELAERSEINKASVSQYANGTHSPSNIKAEAMATILKVSPLWLMGFDVPMEDSREKKKESISVIYEKLPLDQKERLYSYAKFLEKEGDPNA